jgi:hypothetical protein
MIAAYIFWLSGINELVFLKISNLTPLKRYLRWYHTLQGENSLKSYDVCMEISSISVIKTYVASEFIALSLLVGIC